MFDWGKWIGHRYSIPREARLKVLGQEQTTSRSCRGGEDYCVPDAQAVPRGQIGSRDKNRG